MDRRRYFHHHHNTQRDRRNHFERVEAARNIDNETFGDTGPLSDDWQANHEEFAKWHENYKEQLQGKKSNFSASVVDNEENSPEVQERDLDAETFQSYQSPSNVDRSDTTIQDQYDGLDDKFNNFGISSTDNDSENDSISEENENDEIENEDDIENDVEFETGDTLEYNNWKSSELEPTTNQAWSPASSSPVNIWQNNLPVSRSPSTNKYSFSSGDPPLSQERLPPKMRETELHHQDHLKHSPPLKLKPVYPNTEQINTEQNDPLAKLFSFPPSSFPQTQTLSPIPSPYESEGTKRVQGVLSLAELEARIISNTSSPSSQPIPQPVYSQASNEAKYDRFSNRKYRQEPQLKPRSNFPSYGKSYHYQYYQPRQNAPQHTSHPQNVYSHRQGSIAENGRGESNGSWNFPMNSQQPVNFVQMIPNQTRYHGTTSHGDRSHYSYSTHTQHHNTYNSYHNNNRGFSKPYATHPRPKWKESKKMMTQEEMETIIRLQQAQIHTDNPYVDDFYYQTFAKKKSLREAGPNQGKVSSFSLQRPIEHKIYKRPSNEPPQGVLGRIPTHSIRAPRPLLQINQDEDKTETTNNEDQPSKRRNVTIYYTILMIIEKAYNCLLGVEDNLFFLNNPTQGVDFPALMTKNQADIDALFKTMHIYLPSITKSDTENLQTSFLSTPNDSFSYDEILAKIFSINKGKKLIARSLPLFSLDKVHGFLLFIMRNFTDLLAAINPRYLPPNYENSNEKIDKHLDTTQQEQELKRKQLTEEIIIHNQTVNTVLVNLRSKILDMSLSQIVASLNAFTLYHSSNAFIEALTTPSGTLIFHDLFNRAFSLLKDPSYTQANSEAVLKWEDIFKLFLEILAAALPGLLSIEELAQNQPFWDLLSTIIANATDIQKQNLFSELRATTENLPSLQHLLQIADTSPTHRVGIA